MLVGTLVFIYYSASSAVSLGIKQGHIETQMLPLSSAIQTRKQHTWGSISKQGPHTSSLWLPLKPWKEQWHLSAVLWKCAQCVGCELHHSHDSLSPWIGSLSFVLSCEEPCTIQAQGLLVVGNDPWVGKGLCALEITMYHWEKFKICFNSLKIFP